MSAVAGGMALRVPPAGAGVILDWAGDIPVRARPVEVKSVRILAWRLVNGCGCKEDQFQTRALCGECIRSSDKDKLYSEGITIFASCTKIEDGLSVAECEKDGCGDRRTLVTTLYRHGRRGGRVTQRRMNAVGGAVRAAPVRVQCPDEVDCIRIITEFAGMLGASS